MKQSDTTLSIFSGWRRSVTIVNLHGNSSRLINVTHQSCLAQPKRFWILRDCPGENRDGDLNLLLIQSVRLFEQAGFRNFVLDYQIRPHALSFMRKSFQSMTRPHGFQEFADYTFVSPGVSVKSFTVPDIPISDHLPMILEC